LRNYVYRSAHAGVMRDRERWFTPMKVPTLVLWWVPAGHLPTIPEAQFRLEKLQQMGPTLEAFSFKQPFPPPSAVALQESTNLQSDRE
jgi:hypothetical protein